MTRRRILFATAEAAPIARVGGLAEAAAGLIRAIRRSGEVDLTVVLPDYGDVELVDEKIEPLDVPEWVGGAAVRSGSVPELGEVSLIDFPGSRKPHPYVDAAGNGWPDNEHRFIAFSAAVAALADDVAPDVIHLNDWHTAMALAYVDLPSVFTIHTLGYQGHTGVGWRDLLPAARLEAFDRGDHLNPVAGAITLANKVIAVSPTYAREILEPHRGAGLHSVLQARSDEGDLIGICNGIDVELWDPATDDAIAAPFTFASIKRKEVTAAELRSRAGWPDDGQPILAMVTRLVEQKGIDLLLGLVPFLEGLGVRVFLLGSGDERLVRWARELAAQNPERLHFVEGYDVALARQLFAGSDLFIMPSRFEPCGLAQMQAMRYGTIPVVTPVGGLLDTVIDADDDPDAGNGFVARTVDTAGLVDAIHRALNAWRVKGRRRTIHSNAMNHDWSWDGPMRQHLDLYADLYPDISADLQVATADAESTPEA